jgi:hypothetical protein
MRSVCILHASSQQFVLFSFMIPMKFRTFRFSSILNRRHILLCFTKRHTNYKDNGWSREYKCTVKMYGGFYTYKNANITWYLTVINIWPVRWLEANLCLQVCLKPMEVSVWSSILVFECTHRHYYQKHAFARRVKVAFSCLMSLSYVTSVSRSLVTM